MPFDAGLIAELEEQVELLGEELVVVLSVIAEEWIGLDEGAAADDDLGASLGDEIEGGEVLEDADRIVGAEDGYGGGETDVLGARSGGGEQDCGRGGDVLFAVVFADAVDVDTGGISEFYLFEELVDTFSAELTGRAAGAESCLYEAIYTDLHDECWMIGVHSATHGGDCGAHVPIER